MWKLVQPYKWLAFGLLAAALCAVISLGFWRGMAAIEGLVETARAEATVLANAKWQAQIEKSNAEVAVKQAAQAINAAAADGAAQLQIAALETELKELETSNETLPDAGFDVGGCGLDAGRVRILAR